MKFHVFFLCFILVISTAYAAEESLLDQAKVNEQIISEQSSLQGNPGITPDSPWYGFKRAAEDISLAFTFDKKKKAEKTLQYADRRLLELKALSEKGNIDDIEDVRKAHKKALERVKDDIEFFKTYDDDVEEEVVQIEQLEDKLRDHEDKIILLEDSVEIKVKQQLTAEPQEKLRDFIQSLKQNTEDAKKVVEEGKLQTEQRLQEKEDYTPEGAKNKVEEIKKEKGLDLEDRARAVTAIKDADLTIEEAKMRIDKAKDLLCYKECVKIRDSNQCAIKCLTTSTTTPIPKKDLEMATANIVSENQAMNETNTVQKKPSREMTFRLDFDGGLVAADGEEPLKSSGSPEFSDDAVRGQSLVNVGPRDYSEYLCEDNFNPEEGTVQAWVKFDSFSGDAVIWHTDDSKYVLYYDLGSRDGYKAIKARAGQYRPEARYKFDMKDRPTDEPNTWKDTGWHFVAMTWKGNPQGIVKVFIDGKLEDTRTYDDGEDCYTFRVGNNYWPGLSWDVGKIDELEMYNYARPHGELWNAYRDYGVETTQDEPMAEDEVEEKPQCPELIPPAPNFCMNGTTKPVKEKGCTVGYECKEPQNTKFDVDICEQCTTVECQRRCAEVEKKYYEVEKKQEQLEKQLEETRERIKEDYEKIAPMPEPSEAIVCPNIASPRPGFCEQGDIIPSKDKNGCIVAYKCGARSQDTKDSEVEALNKNIVKAEKELNKALDFRDDADEAFWNEKYQLAENMAGQARDFALKAIKFLG